MRLSELASIAHFTLESSAFVSDGASFIFSTKMAELFLILFTTMAELLFWLLFEWADSWRFLV